LPPFWDTEELRVPGKGKKGRNFDWPRTREILQKNAVNRYILQHRCS